MAYVHGYRPTEAQRLRDQAGTLADLIHAGIAYRAGSRILEAGCGVGAQTVTLATRHPFARITAIDVSASSLAEARHNVEAVGAANVTFEVANILDLPFENASFDHVFLCFVLEHLRRPVDALVALRRMLRPGGTLTVIEGDHGSVSRSSTKRASMRASPHWNARPKPTVVQLLVLSRRRDGSIITALLLALRPQRCPRSSRRSSHARRHSARSS